VVALLYWHAEATRLERTPKSSRLIPPPARRGAPLPLVLLHKLGKGRFAFIGVDDTCAGRPTRATTLPDLLDQPVAIPGR